MVNYERQCRPVRRGKWWTTVPLLACLSALQLARAQQLVKLWSTDVSQNEHFRQRLQTSEVLLRPPGVGFVDSERIILWFEDADPTRVDQERSGFGFHVLEIAAKSGSFGRKLSFNVFAPSEAVTTGDGAFIVLAGEELKRFDSAFTETAHTLAPLELHGRPKEQYSGGRFFSNSNFEFQEIDLSPDGQETILAHMRNPELTEVRWLRSQTFTEIATAHTGIGRWRQMSGSNQAILLSQRFQTKSLWSSGRESTLCDHCFRSYFISDDLIFQDERDSYEIRNLAGKSLAKGKLRQGALGFSRAAKAHRLVYATGEFRGSGFPLKTHFTLHMQIRIFDWDMMKDLAILNLDEPEKQVSTGFRLGALALSPDGNRLLVFAGSTLSCYQLQK